MRTALKSAKRWLLLGHRWLGIATAPLFVAWIGSGLVMLYVPFPGLTEGARLARLVPIAWERVTVSPDAALDAAKGPIPRAFSLEMRGSEPVYWLAGPDGAPLTLSAATGTRLPAISVEDAIAIAGGRPGTASVERVERDQWTVTARYDPMRPFHKVALGDAAGSEVYVSAPTGAIALVTTRSERVWNWLGAVIHWIYPTELRARPELWRDVVLWLSGIAALNALTGVSVGIWRLRLRRRTREGAITPYRGLARWHHLFGLAGGLTLTTFIVSGWLSMNPNRWFSSPRPPAEWLEAQAGPPVPLGIDAARLAALAPDAVSVQFSRIGGRWLATASTPGNRRTASLDGSPTLNEETLVEAVSRIVPGGTLRQVERLTAYDVYWYPHHDDKPLPVLRLVFDDPAATWIHLDPRDGAILSRLDRSGRANRWLFSAFHRLDLPVLIFARPAWDIAQWLLNGLGAGIALTGLVIGWRRLKRSLRLSSSPR